MIPAFRPNALCAAFVAVIAYAAAQDQNVRASHPFLGVENIQEHGLQESKFRKELINDTFPSKIYVEHSLGSSDYKERILQGPKEDIYAQFSRYGDLGVRFNMVSDDNGPFFDLDARDYPIRGDLAERLKEDSIGDSIVTDGDRELPGNFDAVDYIARIGAAPTMPNSDPRHPFWEDFREVVNIQLARRAGADPNSIFRIPDLWQDKNIHDVAQAVYNEYPGSLQQELIEKLFKEGVELDYDVVPFRWKRDIIAKHFLFADLNTWVYSAVAPTTFYVKWHVGRPRPEEVAWKIATSELTTAHGVPEDIAYKIDSMNLQRSYDFTAYDEGCPTHPSWPAMHSSASVTSLWLSVLCKDLTWEQRCEALRMDYAVAFARTVAGVNYSSDNIAGLNLGQKVMKEKLADHFVKYYGSDRTAVQAKIERYSFDWADFDPNDCTFRR